MALKRDAEENLAARVRRRGPRPSKASARTAAEIPPIVAAVQSTGAAAWPAFLDEYSDFILRCLTRVTYEYDERMEVYAQVCERLRADDCRRLRQFRGHGARGACKFTTWLSAVVNNMAREWVRTSRGRRRLYRRVQRLSSFDRAVFRYHYWEGLEADQIAATLSSQSGRKVPARRVDEALARLRQGLGAENLWRLAAGAARSRQHQSISEAPSGSEKQRTVQPATTDPNAEALAASRSARAALGSAIRDLPAELGEVLELRYGKGHTARQIAVHMGMDNYKRVYELQARALVLLRDALKCRGLSPGELSVAGDHTEVDHDA